MKQRVLSKEQFLRIIDFIKTKDKQEDKFCSVLEELVPGEYCNAFIFYEYRDLVFNLLQTMFDDQSDLIVYKMYEFDNFSEEAKKQQLKLTPELESWGTVYDYLVRTHDE